jgi:hypothetical protein
MGHASGDRLSWRDLDALADPTCIRAFVSAMIEAIGMRAAIVAVKHFSGTATLRLLRR